MDDLKDAVTNFVNRCDLSDTSIAIETFPRHEESMNQLALTCRSSLILATVLSLRADGDTPLVETLKRCLADVPMTRGVIVSDGRPTDWSDCGEDYNAESLLRQYAEQGIPLDCVHIGESVAGEDLLRRIAKVTGGIYIKFRDTSSFATAFAYLTPGLRGLLTSGAVDAKALGAAEVTK